MKQYKMVSKVYTDPNGKAGDLYVIENGLHVRDVYIDAGIGEEICIGHVSDLHFNYCNAQDMAEANPVIMSTIEYRLWQANAKALPNAQRALEFLTEQCEQTVVNGDTLDYLTHGARWIMIAALAGPKTEIDLKNIYVRNVRIIGSTLRSRAPSVKAEILAGIVRDVYPKIEAGLVKPTIHAVLPIEKAEEAQDILYQGRNIGKVVLTVG